MSTTAVKIHRIFKPENAENSVVQIFPNFKYRYWYHRAGISSVANFDTILVIVCWHRKLL